jgi:hypothetical protein
MAGFVFVISPKQKCYQLTILQLTIRSLTLNQNDCKWVFPAQFSVLAGLDLVIPAKPNLACFFFVPQ